MLDLEPATRAVAQTAEAIDDPQARNGLFGPVVAVPEDAPLLHRVLGGAGRDPGWSPAG